MIELKTKADYYQSDAWSTKEERIKAEEKREEKLTQTTKSGKPIRITLDFAGRRIIQEDIEDEEQEELKTNEQEEEEFIFNPNLTGKAGEIYQEIRQELDLLPCSNSVKNINKKDQMRIGHLMINNNQEED